MTRTASHRWEAKRTDETRLVDESVKGGGFEQVDSYRYNSASIRVRVIDPRFQGLSHSKRVDLVEPFLETLPERTQGDIIEMYLFTPSEIRESPRTLGEFRRNAEFERPSPSRL